MIRNPTLAEFEAATTMRVIWERLVDRTSRTLRTVFNYDEALWQSVYAANDILRECGISRELWAGVRGRRAYIFHEPTGRIAAEFGVVTDEAERGMRRRLKVMLMGRGGRALGAPTIGDLAVEINKLGQFRGQKSFAKPERRNYGRKH
jgi:hypothetical protein